MYWILAGWAVSYQTDIVQKQFKVFNYRLLTISPVVRHPYDFTSYIKCSFLCTIKSSSSNYPSFYRSPQSFALILYHIHLTLLTTMRYYFFFNHSSVLWTIFGIVAFGTVTAFLWPVLSYGHYLSPRETQCEYLSWWLTYDQKIHYGDQS